MKTSKSNPKTASPGKAFALIVLAILIASLGYGWHRVVSAQSSDKRDLQPEIVTITQFPLPNPSPAAQAFGIRPYLDHAMWFTEKATGKLGRITPDGNITEYALPDPNRQPTDLVVATYIWVTESNANKIGRINPLSVVSEGAIIPGTNFTEFNVPTANSQPFAMTLGVGGIFFTEAIGNRLGFIKNPSILSVTITEFEVPTPGTLQGIVADLGGTELESDGRIWFAETSANKIGYFKETSGAPDFIVCEDKVGA